MHEAVTPKGAGAPLKSGVTASSEFSVYIHTFRTGQLAVQAAYAPLGGSVAQGTVPTWEGFALLRRLGGGQREIPVTPLRALCSALKTPRCLLAFAWCPACRVRGFCTAGCPLPWVPKGLEGGWRPDASSSWINGNPKRAVTTLRSGQMSPAPPQPMSPQGVSFSELVIIFSGLRSSSEAALTCEPWSWPFLRTVPEGDSWRTRAEVTGLQVDSGIPSSA